MIIGMLHYRKDPTKVTRAYLYAAIAKVEGVGFYYFTPGCIDLTKQTILGKYYDKGKWMEQEISYPDVIMNIAGPLSKKQAKVYNDLKKVIPFTSHPLGSKLSVYKKIIKAKEFADYVIPYQKIKKAIDVLGFVSKYQTIIIKPIRGNHGKGVYRLEVKNNKYIIKYSNTSKTLTKIELLDYIEGLIVNQKMLMQKFIDCRKDNGDVYDFRLHLQKNRYGKWENTIIYPKIAVSDRNITNLGQGGQIALLKEFLYNEFDEDYYNIKRYLEVFALRFTNHFDCLYDNKLDEIGIDIGVDNNHKIWIYEVNWRPGHLFIEYNTARNAIFYAIYLGELK